MAVKTISFLSFAVSKQAIIILIFIISQLRRVFTSRLVYVISTTSTKLTSSLFRLKLHRISFLFQSSLSLVLDIPKNGHFRIMIKYSLPISDSAQVNIALMDDEDGSVINSSTNTFRKCATSCYHRMSSEFLYLDEGKVDVLVNSVQGDMKLVSTVWQSVFVTGSISAFRSLFDYDFSQSYMRKDILFDSDELF